MFWFNLRLRTCFVPCICDGETDCEKHSSDSYFFSIDQITDPSEIEKMVDRVLENNPKQLEQYRGGKTKLQGYFAGQVQL